MLEKRKMMLREFYTCPRCGGVICGEKRKYFICSECGKALCKVENLPDFAHKYCGNCGTKITMEQSKLKSTVEERIQILEKKGVIKEFYSCTRCGRVICGEKRKYFICSECGEALCSVDNLHDFDDNYCINCGAKITSAIDGAMALAGETD